MIKATKLRNETATEADSRPTVERIIRDSKLPGKVKRQKKQITDVTLIPKCVSYIEQMNAKKTSQRMSARRITFVATVKYISSKMKARICVVCKETFS